MVRVNSLGFVLGRRYMPVFPNRNVKLTFYGKVVLTFS